jgi:hypothetical protein
VPKAKAADPGNCSAHCSTVSTLAGLGYSQGACTPIYVIYDTNGATGVTIAQGMGMSMMPAGCQANELCAPCMNPIMPGMPSGACY